MSSTGETSGGREPAEAKAVVEPSPQGDTGVDTSERALRQRIRQQEMLAELGVLALQGTPFRDLLEHTSRLVAEGLQAEFCKVMEHQPDQGRLLVRAGVGWDPALIGTATVGADLASPAGFALRTGKPVISNHLENEERFRTPELLVEHGIRRAMNVILQGDGRPFGVLEVDSRSEGEFDEHDIAFLQGAANLLGMAIERQRIESQLRTALEQREILLQEVNHRLKNSLQLVASMLHLQAGAAEREEVRQELLDAGTRITAVARAHARLYRSDDVRSLELSGYLIDLCADLGEVRSDCKITVDAPEPVEIATDRAIPLALVVNELVTNAVKHAGEDGPCEVEVRLRRVDEERIELIVADDGGGLPDGFDPKTGGGLGMRLVMAFAQQLEAGLKVHPQRPGTEFVLDIPLQPKRRET